MRRRFLFILLFPLFTWAQKPVTVPSSVIYQEIKKLNVLGTVLYMAAHPDDENTALIAYYANQKLYNTNYLSLTRGDGGQDLIGPEMREKLGIIRTQELLQARRLDDGHQYFATANDFGFSKNPEEVFTKWPKDTLLANAVWIIRNLQPDVMITRFPKDARAGHGQHSASSILAEAAFKAAGDPNMFPEQLKYVKPWKVKRLVWNTSAWGFSSKKVFDEYAKNLIHFNIGVYNSALGKSIGEMAAESRSMHKSQAFGSAGNRGSIEEYFEPTLGVTAKKDLFEDVNTTWSRIPHSEKVQQDVNELIAHFSLENPTIILPQLIQTYKDISALENSDWKKEKLNEVKMIMQQVLGLYLSSTTSEETIAPGDHLTIITELTNRSNTNIQFKSIDYKINGINATQSTEIKNDEDEDGKFQYSIQIPQNTPYSFQYWLKEKHDDAMYHVANMSDLNSPENLPAISTTIHLTIDGLALDYSIPVQYKNVDPVKGELYNPIWIAPKGFVNLDNSAYIFANGQAKTVKVKVSTQEDALNGTVGLNVPKGWSVTPQTIATQLTTHDERDLEFTVTPNGNIQNGEIQAFIVSKGDTNNLSLDKIQYDHIPTQLYMYPALAKTNNIDIAIKGKNIGYLMGAGDDVPAGLRQIGYNVTLLQDKDMTLANLQQFDAVMIGVRAYNVLPKIAHYQDVLLEYCQNGGNVVAQYNVYRGLQTNKIGPYPLQLSNDRVTDENAKITFTNPDNKALNYPNKITEKDFDGWVQERGLYFPDQWDEKYQTIIACHDPNEKDLAGGILIAPYGKGYFVYSAYDWFRELPAGVPGAYRLLANLLSLGK